MAFGYAGACFFVWVSFIASRIVETDTSLKLKTDMTPLQGFFNFIVFVAPKVRIKRMTAIIRRHHLPFDMVPSILYSLSVKKIPVTEVSLVARIDQIYLPSWWNRCLQKR